VEFLDMNPATIAPRFDGVNVSLDWIHRRDGETDFYFVANLGDRSASARVAFRATGRQPEWWDAVTGQVRDLPDFRMEQARTIVPLKFEAKQSHFVVFRRRAPEIGGSGRGANFPEAGVVAELTGPWEVTFDPRWGGPSAPVTFAKLGDWTQRAEPELRYYSGAATYRYRFDDRTPSEKPAANRMFLDLGVVKNLAAVRLNGMELGVVWTAPWRVEITAALKPAGNVLEIEVVNLWPNRLIGDAALPPEKRHTTTNVKKFKKDSPLLSSGLLGPVTLRAAPALVPSR
jgi:hypothetical protein